MKIAIAQIKSILGTFEDNLKMRLEYIIKVKERRSDLVILPGLSHTGYSLKDLTGEVAVREFKALFRSEGATGING